MKTLLRRLKMKRVWLVAAVAAMVASAATIGGVAADGWDRGKGNRDAMNSRVAEILEMEEETVADAFSDAKEQKVEEAIQAWLDGMVESGEITQEQADEFTTWYDARPDWVENVRAGRPGPNKDGESLTALVAETLGVEEETVTDAVKQAAMEFRSEKMQERLDQAVADGKITQEQADQIAERLESGDPKGFSWQKGGGWKRGGGWGYHDKDMDE